MDPAQIFRQTVNTTRFDTTAGVSNRAAAATAGQAMGFAVVADEEACADVYYADDEAMRFFTDFDRKRVTDRTLGETRMADAGRRARSFQVAFERWTKAFPDMPAASLLSALLRRLRTDAMRPSARDLLRQLAERADDDASLIFAALDCMEQDCSPEEAELLALIREAKRLLEQERGAEMRAGINLADEVNARASSPEELKDLRRMYRGEVLGFTTPQSCFRSLLGTRGAGQIAAAIEFLIAATGADLQATTPSTSPEELRRIMLDLACVEVLKTVLERLCGLEARMRGEFGERCLLNGEAMTGRVVDMTEQQFATAATVGAFLTSCGILGLLAKLDFMTQLTDVFRMLSPRMFASEKDRFALVDSAQEVLDELVDRADGEDRDPNRRKGEDAA